MGKIEDFIKEKDRELEQLKDEVFRYSRELVEAEGIIKTLQGSFAHIHPVKVYRTKSRGNTTIIFQDGSSETVRLKKGEKDCIDTAIAYALMKHVYPGNVLNELKKHIEEINTKK